VYVDFTTLILVCLLEKAIEFLIGDVLTKNRSQDLEFL